MLERGIKPTRECLTKGRATQIGPKHPRWNPNKDTDAIDRLLFNTYVTPLVRQRDNYTCATCNVRGGTLHAHHIKPFAVCPELRFSFVNVITLCDRCHKALHTSYGISSPEQSTHLWKFLRAQLTSKESSRLELDVLQAIRSYRDVLAKHEGNITEAWKALEMALRAYKEHHNYD